jgi:uncharacterized protein (TIGR02246 family)
MHGFKTVVTLAAVAAAACADPTPRTPEADRQAIEAEVTEWVQTFLATFAEGRAGYDRGMAMFDDHPDFSFAVNGVLWRSLAAVDEAIRPSFQAVDHQTFDLPVRSVAVLGPDLAHVSAAGTLQADVAGESGRPTPYAVTMVLVRANGVWKVRFVHQSMPNTANADAG